jgi:hypothetical protein
MAVRVSAVALSLQSLVAPVLVMYLAGSDPHVPRRLVLASSLLVVLASGLTLTLAAWLLRRSRVAWTIAMLIGLGVVFAPDELLVNATTNAWYLLAVTVLPLLTPAAVRWAWADRPGCR